MRIAPFMFSLLLCSGTALAQINLAGIVDLHVHCNPDSNPPRRIDAFEVARLFQKEGMRAFVIKSHYTPTAQLAYAVNQTVPGVTAYGGLVLNLSVGGMNPYAVEQFGQVTGGYARIVWMPTMDAENVARQLKEKHPFVRVSKDGVLLPETVAVLKMIKQQKLVLATGHLSPEEAFLVVEEARKLGIGSIIGTHPMTWPVGMTIDQMRKLAGMGVYIEFVYNLIYPDPNRKSQHERLGFSDYARAIHAIGAERCILAVDVGQPQRPVHTEAWKEYITGLLKAGVTEHEIDLMARRNPARIIGLGDMPKNMEATVQHFDAVKEIKYPWGWIRWMMNSQLDPGAAQTFGVVEINPGQRNPLHSHPNCEELLYVISGSCEHIVGDKKYVLKAGDLIRVPAGIAHQAIVVGNEPMRAVISYSSADRQMLQLDQNKE
jgi:quercetin dioxygenase-like cupin family protein